MMLNTVKESNVPDSPVGNKPRTLVPLTDHLSYYADDPAHILCLRDEKYVEARYSKDQDLLKAGLDAEKEMHAIGKYRRIMSQYESGDVSEELAVRAIRAIFPKLPETGILSGQSRKKHDSNAATKAETHVQAEKKEEMKMMNEERIVEGREGAVVQVEQEKDHSVQACGYLPDVEWALETMRRFQELKRRLLESTDVVIRGEREYPKKSGCRKYALAFRLSLETFRIEHEMIGDEKIARAWTRATAPDGVYVDGYGVCDSETVRKSKMDPTWHNIESKAQTRSYNRAILDLVGGGEVSAEEIE